MCRDHFDTKKANFDRLDTKCDDFENFTTTAWFFAKSFLFQNCCESVWIEIYALLTVPGTGWTIILPSDWRLVLVGNFGSEVSTRYLFVGRFLILKFWKIHCGISRGGSSDTFSHFRKFVYHVCDFSTSEAVQVEAETCKAVWKIPDLSRLFLSLGKWEIVSVAEIFEFINFGGWICYWRPVLNPEVSTSYLVVGRSLILKILEKLCGISPGGSSDTFSSFRKTVTHVRVSPTSEVAIKDFGKLPEFLWLSFSRQGFESR